MSTTTETITRPARAPAASVVLTTLAVVGALLLAPFTPAAAAEPLPTGTYRVELTAGEVTLRVAPDGAVTLAASDGLVVRLAFDEDRRVLDEFTVTSDTAAFRVEVDLEEDGTYRSRVEEHRSATDEDDGSQIVRTVAGCAPTGLVARAVGLPNHGTIVSAAASGLALEAEVIDPVSGAVSPVQADFSTLAGAEAFCAQVDAAVPTLHEVRETLAAEARAARADRATAQQDRAAAQAALARARATERAAERAAQRAADRGPAAGDGRPDDPGASRSPSDRSDTSRPEEGGGGGDGTSRGQDATDTTEDDTTDTPDGTPTDDTDQEPTGTGTTAEGDATDDGGSTTGDTSGSATAGGASTTTGPGQGNGKPADPGATGKGPGR